MNRTLTRLALLFLSLVILPQPAFAPPPPPIAHGSLQALQSCRRVDDGKFYVADSADLPAALAAFAGNGPRLAFRVCSDFDENTHYFMRNAASPDLPVCEITESEIFPDPGSGLVVQLAFGNQHFNPNDYLRVTDWSHEPPKDWQTRGYSRIDAMTSTVLAQAKHGTCPSPTDLNFAHLQNVPPGLFKAIVDALRKAPTENPGLFRSADADPGQFSNVRPTWVFCNDFTCSAFLNNGFTATFDAVNGTIKLTSILRYMD